MTAVARKTATPPEDRPIIEDAGETLLKLPDVERITALGKTTIYKLIGEGTFPKPRKFGGDISRWLRSDIVAWMRSLPTD
jgi:prophage regulatory protein